MRDICYNLKHDNRSEYERCVFMTVNEMQSYLNQVVEVEGSLMGLRASYEGLKLRDMFYKAVGTDPDYCLDDPFFLNNDCRTDSGFRKATSNMEKWLEYRDSRYELEKIVYGDENDETDGPEEMPSFSNYLSFSRKKSNETFDDIVESHNEVKYEIFKRHFKMPSVVKDELPEIEKVPEPEKVDPIKPLSKARKIGLYLSALYLTLQFGVICLIAIGGFLGIMLFVLIAAGMFLLIQHWAIRSYEKKVKAYEAYLEKKKAYDEYLRKKGEIYNMDPYKTAKANFFSAFDRAKAIATKVYEEFAVKRNQAIESELNKLEKQIRESEEVLDKLYAMNVLHPKYRNLTAASIILEYLETGRCSELTGHEGAYNLYESELRQNLIIAKLDVVIQKLDELKATMYRCCMAVENVGKQVKGLEKELKTLNATAAKQLAVQTETLKLTALNATYSAAIAANTEAIKYLTLVQ